MAYLGHPIRIIGICSGRRGWKVERGRGVGGSGGEGKGVEEV